MGRSDLAILAVLKDRINAVEHVSWRKKKEMQHKKHSREHWVYHFI
jgi:hypothetical protein